MNSSAEILGALAYFKELKTELRHTWLPNDRRESVAEHSWRMALLAMILIPNLKTRLDSEKILKMVLVHDLSEIEAKDEPTFKHINNKVAAREKHEKEVAAIESIKKILPGSVGEEVFNLWHEFEDQKTTEAKFVKFLDKAEAREQKIHQKQARFVSQEKEISFIDAYRDLMGTVSLDEPLLKELNQILHRKRIEASNGPK
jgi:putative hydrolase of HD superfamily